MLLGEDFQFFSRGPPPKKTASPKHMDSVYDLWLASREIPAQKGTYFVPGTQRPLNLANAHLAWSLAQQCVYDFVREPVTSYITLR